MATNAVINTSLLTQAAETRLSNQIDQLALDVEAHINAGYEAHARTAVKNVVFAEPVSTHTLVGSKKITLGALFNGGQIYVDVPALPY